MYRERMYSPEEVRHLLSRAAAIEESRGKGCGSEGAPLTFDQLATLARDAGISEESLRRAETESPQAPKKRLSLSIAGAPTKIGLERTVRGYVGPSNHATLVRTMRDALGEAGSSQVLGESLEWSTTRKNRQVHITIEPLANGEVNVRIDEDLRKQMVLLFGEIVVVLGGGMIELLINLLPPFQLLPLVIALSLLALFLVTRKAYAASYRAREAEIQALLDELVEHVHGATRAPELRARVASGADERERHERAAAEEAAAIEEAENIRTSPSS